MKKKLNKFIVKLKGFLLRTKKIIKDNPIVIFFLIGTIINGLIVRLFTIGDISIGPLFADLFVGLLVSSICFLIKEKYRFLYLFIFAIISSIICIANIIYYSYYESFISITFISFALTNYDTGGANVVGDLLKIKYFICLIFPFLLLTFYIFYKKSSKYVRQIVNKTNTFIFLKWALLSFLFLTTTLNLVDYGRFYTQWNREHTVSKFGVYLYQINDIVKSIEPKMASLFGSDEAKRDINKYYEKEKKIRVKNEYSDIFKGKNVIAIHAESMQNALLNMKINNKEITPNLNKLAKEGIYFSNFYSQVSFGTSSDTELTLATTLLPINNGTVFIHYADRTYPSYYKLLQDRGYYTFSMHANTGDFWNRNIMHKNLGYNDFFDKSSYTIEEDEKIGFGLSDKAFILQSVEKIEKIAKEHKNYYGTLITLSNHTPFADIDKYGEFDVSMTVNGVKYPYMEKTKLGNYFKSAHYADEQLGLLIESLDKKNLLDNTVIMIYGDHDARISSDEWEKLYNYDYKKDDIIDSDDPRYIDIDYYWYELNKSVPLIMWTNDNTIKEKMQKEVTTAMGMYDVMPTLSNMLGFSYEYAIGNDIFNKDDNIVVFPNGNFLTNYVYYNDSKSKYKMLQDTELDVGYIEECKKIAKERLSISNKIIIYDYFKKDLKDESGRN